MLSFIKLIIFIYIRDSAGLTILKIAAGPRSLVLHLFFVICKGGY